MEKDPSEILHHYCYEGRSYSAVSEKEQQMLQDSDTHKTARINAG